MERARALGGCKRRSVSGEGLFRTVWKSHCQSKADGLLAEAGNGGWDIWESQEGDSAQTLRMLDTGN